MVQRAGDNPNIRGVQHTTTPDVKPKEAGETGAHASAAKVKKAVEGEKFGAGTHNVTQKTTTNGERAVQSAFKRVVNTN